MSELLSQMNFSQIFFKNNVYEKEELNAAISTLANYLQKNIRSPSPFIVLTAYNHIKTLIAFYAIVKIGRIAVIHDPQSRKFEFEEIIKDTEPAAIILINNQTISFRFEEEIIIRSECKSFCISSDLANVCALAYTNAEDGYSKGAMITQENLLYEIKAIIETNNISSNSVSCALLPYSHLYGFVHGILLPSLSGASGLIAEVNLLKISDMLQEVRDCKVTHLHTVPSIYYILSKMPDIESYCKHIVRFFSGGIQLPQFIFDIFYQKTGYKIWEGYGLTECSPAAAGNYNSENPVIGSFGKPFPGCSIKIINENGLECAVNEIGEITVKGNMVFKGYFNHPEATQKVLKDGWLLTGDFGKKDNNGNFYFCGLKKNMINTAGNKVYPKKLERLLQLNENAMQVNVFSEPSFLQGDIIKARIKLKNVSKKKQEELKRWCLENINNALVPKIYEFY